MSKKNGLRWLGGVCFAALLGLALVGVYQVFSLKLGGVAGLRSGTLQCETLYEQPENSIDVLVLGASHAYQGISTGTLYEEYGIAAYDLCASSQAVWNSYYYLKEALKTQKPSLIVLEPYTAALLQHDYSTASNPIEIAASLDGMRLSQNKIDAAKASVAEGDDWLAFLLGWPVNHARYTDLTERDYLPWQGNEAYYRDWKGFEAHFGTANIASLHVEETLQVPRLYEKTEQYYRAILELAQSEDIPICVVVTPYPSYNTGKEKPYYNTLKQIAESYDVLWVDYNTNESYEELELDPATDFEDTGHLNYFGAVKFTKALGEMLKEDFTLPDRRGDEAYASWQANADYDKAQAANALLRKETDLTQYLRTLARSENDYTILLDIADCGAARQYAAGLKALGIDVDKSAKSGSWVVRDGQVLCDASGQESCLWTVSEGYDDLTLEKKNGTVRLLAGSTNYRLEDSGVNILVWDNELHTLADAVTFDAQDGYSAFHRGL